MGERGSFRFVFLFFLIWLVLKNKLFPLFSPDFTKLMVATGYFDLKSVEVLNLDPAKPEQICDNLPDLPVGLNGATGQLLQVAMKRCSYQK